MADVKQRLAEGWLRCTVVIELIGKPKEHIEQTMKQYVEKIRKEKDIEVLRDELAAIKKLDTKADQPGMIQELWSTFAELDMLVRGPMALTYFCFDYMPASIEIVEPAQVSYKRDDLTEFFNNLQSRLHQLDMLAKQLRTEVLFLRKSTKSLLRNYVTLLLTKKKLTAQQLSSLTGVDQQGIEDFLDTLIDEGRLRMEGELYTLKDENREPPQG